MATFLKKESTILSIAIVVALAAITSGPLEASVTLMVLVLRDGKNFYPYWEVPSAVEGLKRNRGEGLGEREKEEF